jgi:hypothetical protein
MSNLKDDFLEYGYAIAQAPETHAQVARLKQRFELDFQSRFGSDPATNRNLIKRFADSIELAELFSSPALVDAVRSIGVEEPVYCGPVVSHYTHSDQTGNSYGLPWHQDFPSMASSANSAIVWVSVNACNSQTHSMEVAPKRHAQGLLPGTQLDNGYVLTEQTFADSCVLDIQAGDILVFSPYLPHRTYVNPASQAYKLSFSRRFDDLRCQHWAARKFANAYGVSVDRSLYTQHTNV